MWERACSRSDLSVREQARSHKVRIRGQARSHKVSIRGQARSHEVRIRDQARSHKVSIREQARSHEGNIRKFSKDVSFEAPSAALGAGSGREVCCCKICQSYYDDLHEHHEYFITRSAQEFR